MMKRFFSSVLGTMLSGALLWGGVAYAQEGAAVSSVSKSSVASPQKAFTGMLEQFAEQERIAFVVEGRPTAQLSVPSQNATPQTDDGVLNKVNAVADTFGYSAERRGSVFLLRKRYNTPTDLPDISIAECAACLQDVDGLLAPLRARFDGQLEANQPTVNLFLRQVTLAQVDKIKQQGLPVSELSPAAKQVVQSILQYIYVSLSYNQVNLAYKMLQAVNSNPVYLLSKEENGQTVFGYETRTFKGQELYQVTVESAERRNVKISSAKGGEPFFDYLEVGKEDPYRIKRPGQVDTPVVASDTEAPPAPTLRDITRQLTSGTVVCDVEESLAPKTVTLIGTNKLSVDSLMQHLASVYGLRLRHRDDGSLYLARRTVPNARNIADLQPSVRAAVPDALARAIQGHLRNPDSCAQAAKAVREEAIRQLRVTVEPKIQKATDHRIALTDLTPEEQRLFAIAVSVSRCHPATEFALQTPPPSVTNFDSTILAGGLTRDDEGKPFFMLYFAMRDAKGRVIAGPGAGTDQFKLPEH